jgi:hypothetical protein
MAWYIAWLALLTVIGTTAVVIVGKWGSKTVPDGIEELEERLL